jgi:hypothetical protein
MNRVALQFQDANDFDLLPNILLGFRLVVELVGHFGHWVLQHQLTLFAGDAAGEGEGRLGLSVVRRRSRDLLLWKRFWSSGWLGVAGTESSSVCCARADDASPKVNRVKAAASKMRIRKFFTKATSDLNL